MNMTVNGDILGQITSFSYTGHVIIDGGRRETNKKENKNSQNYVQQHGTGINIQSDKQMIENENGKMLFIYLKLLYGDKARAINKQLES